MSTETKTTVPRMRTIKELAQLVKAEDPDTRITPTAIRRFIITGQLPHVMVGNKYLVSVEVFNDFLKGTH